ncbi:MAG: Tn3 family transposase, partial [Actinomycetota bacterium]|nr:Tn3 family transposase [Actinomycetota bacterium]
MALIERTAYPRFSPRPSAGELARLYTPTSRELDLARRATRGGEAQRLAFLVMLKSFQRLGYFPKDAEVPATVVAHLRSRLGLGVEVAAAPPTRSRQRYRDAIRAHLGVKAYGDDARRVAAEAVAGAALTMDEPADLVNVAVEELVKERFELPAFSTLDRLARKVRHAANARLFSRVDGTLPYAGRARLDALLEADAGGRSDLGLLKAPPKSATRKNLSAMQESLLWMESLGDTRLLLSGIPNQKAAHLAAQARALDASELKKIGPERRRAMLVSLIHRAKVSCRDGLAEMLVKTVGKAHSRAKERLEDLHREKRAATEALVGILERILVGAQDDVADDAAFGRRVRGVLSEGGGPDALLAAAVSLSAHRGGNHLPLLWGFYKGQRATLFRVARSLVLRPTTEDRSLVGALRFVLESDRLGRRGEFLEGEMDLSFASERWRELVVADVDGRPALARRHLEACVFSCLALELKTGDLSVEGSDEYADYRDQLLSWEECAPLVEEHCRELGLGPTPEGFVGQLREKLAKTALEVDRLYPENSGVAIGPDGEPVLKETRARKPTKALKDLEAAVAGRMPERGLVDVLCAVEHHTGWSRHLGPLSGSEPKLEDARGRYLLTAFCYGTNMGPAQTARHTRGAATAHELGYVNRRHVTVGKLEAAATDMINAYAGLDLPRVWGTGETAAADGTKIELRENTLMSEYHVRYGGYGGIAYHHVSDTYVALFTHFIACGVWEAVYILDGLLKNASEIQPKKIAGDTQAQSAPVFGLSYA